jgi:hypothetical protein
MLSFPYFSPQNWRTCAWERRFHNSIVSFFRFAQMTRKPPFFRFDRIYQAELIGTLNYATMFLPLNTGFAFRQVNLTIEEHVRTLFNEENKNTRH